MAVDELDFSDDDDLIYKLREERMSKLKAVAKNNDTVLYGNGQVSQITTEPELLNLATTIPRLIIHFYQPSFVRCQTMTEHLTILAKSHPRVKFVMVEGSKAPFMVMKMNIRVLPCVVGILDGEALDILVGFEGLGGDGNDFETKSLEKRLSNILK